MGRTLKTLGIERRTENACDDSEAARAQGASAERNGLYPRIINTAHITSGGLPSLGKKR
jgi:hypothetical protein